MRTALISCLAVLALVLSACSATTVVATADRALPTPPALDTSPSETNDATVEDPTTDATEPAVPTDADADQDDDDTVDEADDESATTDDPATSEGFGLGGADQLTSLLADCNDDNDLACDILFQLSDFDSEEELAAITCGGRRAETVVFCTPDITSDGQTSVFDVTSDGLAPVVTACTDEGDMTACDFLYFRSPLDSEFEDIGASCGGRVDAAIPDCRTLLEDE